MESVTANLKRLRESARPKYSVRGLAAALEMAPSAYQHYEDERKFKRPFLPMDMVRKLVPLLTARQVAEAEVLALGGVDAIGGEAVPAIPTPPQPPIQLVTMQVALPSEAALARMLEGLLRPLDRGMPVAELAQILARRLPTGLAQLQVGMPEPAQAGANDPDVAAPDHATDHPASRPIPRT